MNRPIYLLFLLFFPLFFLLSSCSSASTSLDEQMNSAEAPGVQIPAPPAAPQAAIEKAGEAAGSQTGNPNGMAAASQPAEHPTSPQPTPSPPPASPIATPTQPASNLPIQYTYRVINTYPHDPGAFTEGLLYHDGVLYEGTGLNDQSFLRKVELQSGTVLQQIALPSPFFGEGIILHEGKIAQLTWQNNLGFLWDANSFAPLGQFSYPTEGWGMTQDGEKLIMSDGTDTLYFWSYSLFTDTLTDTLLAAPQIGQLTVRDGDRPVTMINELEYIHNLIFANIWQTDLIAQIDPTTGKVVGWIDASGLLTPEERGGADVLNGIAYDAAGDRIFVTGKFWPKLFEIELVEKKL